MTEVVHKRIYANLWRADWSFLPVILMSTLCYWWLNLCILLSLLASTVKSAALQSRSVLSLKVFMPPDVRTIDQSLSVASFVVHTIRDFFIVYAEEIPSSTSSSCTLDFNTTSSSRVAISCIQSTMSKWFFKQMHISTARREPDPS
ncbi:hypothetical protein QVD17_40340 [Tagetes erecta]|uniref:Uncharacterized protein n=1 Tax=Tagetes erecta TaxID=13708 RepID=A0AAD8JTR9_TARER|nr:hypothetical protein QVD17_40340 [Tagetes erecta]